MLFRVKTNNDCQVSVLILKNFIHIHTIGALHGYKEFGGIKTKPKPNQTKKKTGKYFCLVLDVMETHAFKI